jgi:hypothetical protein
LKELAAAVILGLIISLAGCTYFVVSAMLGLRGRDLGCGLGDCVALLEVRNPGAEVVLVRLVTDPRPQPLAPGEILLSQRQGGVAEVRAYAAPGDSDSDVELGELVFCERVALWGTTQVRRVELRPGRLNCP